MKGVGVIFCWLSALSINLAQTKERIIQQDNSYFLSNTIVVKIKEQFSSVKNETTLSERLNKELNKQIVEKVRKEFSATQTLFKGTTSLQRIFCLSLNNNESPIEIAKRLSKLSEVEWAEPKYVRKVCYDPNDEFFLTGRQPYLDVIKAKEAWKIAKGSKNVVIGIIDTGVDIDHPDLAANIFTNKKEIPGNGIDEDDGGKFVDDIHGWDFGGLNGTPDNDPREDRSYNNKYHGTHIAGIASAVTDNFFGISSIGFNCTILPVKVSEDNFRDSDGYPEIIFGFEGIKYAVDKGAKIISCSWGGSNYSKFEQEVIDYAVSNGVLVVAAAGNNDSNESFYPANYKGVFSVGWTNNDDTKSIASNYGKLIDVMAPGTEIYSTWPTISGENPAFHYSSGSSMSAPLVAGLAGLVISKYPNLTIDQVKERIRAACDNIDQKNSSTYNYMLGAGRINAFMAVSENPIYSVRATEVNYPPVHIDDTTAIGITFTNYLNPISNATVTISSNEPFVKIIKPTFETGPLNELGTVKTTNDDFLFTITNNAPTDTTIYFLMKFDAHDYTGFQWIPVNINPSFVTQNDGKIIASVTNKGGLGFSDFSCNSLGNGFNYLLGENLLFEGGLLYGISPFKLDDGIRIKNKSSNDFKVLKSITLTTHNFVNESYSLINDDNANNSRLGIQTQIYSFSFDKAPDDSYIILHFILENTTPNEIRNLYLGYFLDWNLSATDFNNDVTVFDSDDNFVYAYSKEGGRPVVGSVLLSSQGLGYMGIDSNWKVGEVIFGDGFDDFEKWYSISHGIVNNSVSGDISYVISGGPINILPGKEEKFTFAVAAASNMDKLRQAIKSSRDKYNSFITSVADKDQPIANQFVLYQNYPNPFNPITTIRYSIPSASRNSISACKVVLKVFDLLGREIRTLVNEEKMPGNYQVKFDGSKLSSGVYFYQLTAGNFSEIKKLMLLK